MILSVALRVEWLKARARALRFLENIRLLEEEMRRAIVTTEWIANKWDARAIARSAVSAELLDGLSAYAREQAAGERGLALHWSSQWKLVRDLAGRRLTQNERLEIRMGEGDTYFSNDDNNDVDVDDPNEMRTQEPVRLEISLDNEEAQEDE